MRQEVGDAIERSEIEAAFDRYLSSTCRWYDELSSQHERDVALEFAHNRSIAERRALNAAASVGGVVRTAGRSTQRFLAELARSRRAEPCAAAVLVEAFRQWPEAEPGSFLAELARDPPEDSLLIRCAAIDAMGQTGRADYVALLDAYVEPGADPRVIFNAVEASAVITGDAQLARRLLGEEIQFDERLAAGLPHALAAAEGPHVASVVEGLSQSSDPSRRLAAFRAGSLGAGLPSAMTALLASGRERSTTREEADSLVEAVRQSAGDSAPIELMLMARDQGNSPAARGAALLSAGLTREHSRLARSIASSTDDVHLVISLAVALQDAGSGDALEILRAFGGSTDREAALVESLRGTTNGALHDLSVAYLGESANIERERR